MLVAFFLLFLAIFAVVAWKWSTKTEESSPTDGQLSHKEMIYARLKYFTRQRVESLLGARTRADREMSMAEIEEGGRLHGVRLPK